MISVMSATPLMLEPLINTWRSATIQFKTNLCSSPLPEKEKKGIEDWAKFHVIMYRIILEFQGIIKYGWTSPQWPPWGQKKVAIMIDDWICYQILSTNSLRKCMEIILRICMLILAQRGEIICQWYYMNSCTCLQQFDVTSSSHWLRSVGETIFIII